MARCGATSGFSGYRPPSARLFLLQTALRFVLSRTAPSLQLESLGVTLLFFRLLLCVATCIPCSSLALFCTAAPGRVLSPPCESGTTALHAAHDIRAFRGFTTLSWSPRRASQCRPSPSLGLPPLAHSERIYLLP